MRARFWICAAIFAAVGMATLPPLVARAIDYVYLTIDISGPGSGSYHSTDGQISCQITNGVPSEYNTCVGQYQLGEQIVVDAVPAQGSCVMVDFSTCSTSYHAIFALSGDRTTRVTFAIQVFTLSVTKTGGTGTGTVTSIPSGIACGAICVVARPYGTPIALTATPDAGAYFLGWTGACAGQGATCSLNFPANQTTNAVFMFGPPPTPAASATTGPKASKPPATTRPAATPATPSTSPGASSTPAAETTPGDSAPPTSGGSTPASSPAPSDVPLVPAAGSATDVGPIVLAILGAGLFIAAAIGLIGFRSRKGPGPT
jgi:hypothetical protein